MRSALNVLVKDCSNPCLAYFRLANESALPGGDSKDKKAHLKEVTNVRLPESYQRAFEAYQSSLSLLPNCCVLTVASVSPIAFGLAEQGVFESGLRFIRPFGVPAINGSAIKGAIRRVLADRLGLTSALSKNISTDGKDRAEAFRSDLPLSAIKRLDPASEDKLEAWARMFGFVGSKDELGASGSVDFFDAWMAPCNGRFLKLDIVNPHHSEYYRGKSELPAEWDEPIPANFVCVRKGIRFLVAFRAPSDWHPLVKELLKQVLEREGIGGKTNVSYGRFRICE